MSNTHVIAVHTVHITYYLYIFVFYLNTSLSKYYGLVFDLLSRIVIRPIPVVILMLIIIILFGHL